jgi:hypothetical protein
MAVLTDDSYETDGENTRQFFAEERYQSPSEAIREIAGNGYAAIQRAVQEGLMEIEDGVIIFTLGDHLQVRDNGIGVPKSRADNLRTVADSSNRDNPFVLGSYGIGRFSAIMLSENDHFDFITRSREDDSSFGLRLGLDKPSEIDETLEDPGSLVRVDLKDDIVHEELVNWIQRELRWLPVEVVIETPEETFTTGQTEFTDDVEGHTIHYEDENVELLFHDRHDVETEMRTSGFGRSDKYHPYTGVALYNGMPVDIPTRVGGPKQFSFRIKREDGAEIESPHGETTRLPQTTNDRGRLKEENYESFVEWCNDIYRHFGLQELQAAVDEHEDVGDLISDERVKFNIGLHEDVDCSPEFDALLENWNVSLPAFNRTGYGGTRRTFYVRQAVEDYDAVYAGKTANDRKVKVVEDIYDDVLVLSTKRRGRQLMSYETAQKLGWDLIKDVPLDQESLEDMGVSENTIEEVMNQSSVSITLYKRDRSVGTRSDKSRTIHSSVDRAVKQSEVIVVFRKRGEHNISDHWDMLSHDVALVNVPSKVADEMNQRDNVILYEDLTIQSIDKTPVYRDDRISDRVVESRVDGEWYDVDEITADFVVNLDRSDQRLLTITPDSVDIFRTTSYNWENALADETFPDENEEVRDELASLGPDSVLWNRLAQ